MKKYYLLAVAALLLACNMNGQWGKRVKGNGNTVTEERQVGEYSSVSLSGFFDLELVAGTEGDLRLEGEENLLEYVITEVKSGTLHIRTEKGYQLRPSSWKSGGIRITVPVQEIDGVTLSGSGDIVGKTLLKADSFEATISGSGDISLQIEADEVEATLSGSGDMVLEGRSKNLEIRVSGSGDVRAFGLEAENVNAIVSGSADLQVTATEFLKARVSGSGDIQYRGNPAQVDSRTSGSGDVTRG